MTDHHHPTAPPWHEGVPVADADGAIVTAHYDATGEPTGWHDVLDASGILRTYDAAGRLRITAEPPREARDA